VKPFYTLWYGGAIMPFTLRGTRSIRLAGSKDDVRTIEVCVLDADDVRKCVSWLLEDLLKQVSPFGWDTQLADIGHLGISLSWVALDGNSADRVTCLVGEAFRKIAEGGSNGKSP
jgi:hypothetical protein